VIDSWLLVIENSVFSREVSAIEQEIASQPAVWRRAAALAPSLVPQLPPAGARLAVIGCGTSLFMAQAYAAAREAAGAGETDAFPASELPAGRRYDALLVISRSGTTTEVLRVLETLPKTLPTHAIVGIDGTPIATSTSHKVVLDFADEASVVQTRFATTALVLLLASLGLETEEAAAQAERALGDGLPAGIESAGSFVFLGRGWTVGLAHEAALKLREAALVAAESYPALEYRHGPIALASEQTVVWPLGDVEGDLVTDVRTAGAAVVVTDRHPLADLVLVHRVALAIARDRGLDPDHPRNLTRSVVLTSQ
jgi:fructoselysine-6-P-deglycase FrlB-like protein